MKTLKLLLATCLFVPGLVLAQAVNINTADVKSLESISGIGPVKAQAIISYRQQHGAFASVDDLAKVPGLGDKSVDRMRTQLSVGTPVAKASTPAADKKH